MNGQMDLRFSEADIKNPSSIVTLLNEWMDSDVHNREDRMRKFSEAINFYAGNQWIRYVEKERRHEPIPTTENNAILDRPVTNHILRWVTTNVSRFTNKPNLIVDPNSEEMVDKTTAKICEVVLSYLWENLGKDEQYLEAALWGLICGTVFRKSMKRSGLRTIEIPGGDSTALRCVETDIVAPFQIVFDGLPQRWADVGSLLHAQVRRIEDIKKQFTVDLPGYFPAAAEELAAEEIVSTSMNYGEGLKKIIAGSGSFNNGQSSDGELKDCAIYKEGYVRPTRKHPKGLMFCAAGSQLLYFGPSPYYYLEGKFWHPFTSWTWGTMPGSVWGMGLLSQLIPLQRRINQIDALVSYNRKTMAVPGWFAPSACGIPEGTFVGVPGQVKTYDETPLGGKPTQHAGLALPPQVSQERETIIADGNLIALAGDVRSGDNPKGVNTLGQLQILTEQAEMSQAKQTESWEKFIERSELLDLLNFKDCYQVPDEVTVKSFKRFSKDITESDLKSFTGNNIQDNATIRIEKGSTIAKSRVLRQQMLMRMIQMGMFPEMFQDPFQRRMILEEFGMSQYDKDSNIDVKFAEKSIEMMLAGTYPPVLPEVHNADIQLPIIMRYMKDPKYLELDPKVQILFDLRRKELVMALVQAGPVTPNFDAPAPMKDPGVGDDLFAEKGAA